MGLGHWKYPLISSNKWLKLVVNAVTSPLAPAGTSAAFATTVPSKELRVDTIGMFPLPHNVRYCSEADGTTVAFSEYAFALAGMPHIADGTLKLRACTAPMIGPPNGPAASLVSKTRHGVA